MKWWMKLVGWVVFVIYILLLTKFILFKYPYSYSSILNNFIGNNPYFSWYNHNFIPFKTITEYLKLSNEISLSIRFDNLFGNLIGFLPFGFLMPLLFQRFYRLKKVTTATFTLSLFYELCQLFFSMGNFDVDDLLLNTFGGIIGYWIFMLSYFIFQKHRTVRNKHLLFFNK
ncbi:MULTISPECIES: VanZ family protein [Cytobacillus]|uniref:VanZ-like domain-containing protein n=1 Tax=Cytobacillus kochii TaxID=859143 RepID=A0A248TFP7_9BACI|nr:MULTISPECIES: VanZ family protein [Cytobacillus]ASV66942.1 hypothetical protein CKF48_06135 [Cytobacillus kochii]MDQ0185174.1 glycopeptide antibiotics resistance protein [Cytobacillus kochii]MEA1854549.1 VanZ family protein [Cytobacillus sp. OWB-43]